MSRIAKKTVHLLLIAYMVVLYAYILPSHVHQDLLEHKKCILCQCSHLTATTVSACILVFFLISSFFVFLIPRTRKPVVYIPLYSSRAPPRSLFIAAL
jgi:hypothetical protein